MKKYIETPSRFIHYCINCAMEHEEPEMQEAMKGFLSNERRKMRDKIYKQLEKYVTDDEYKSAFINDIMREI